MNDLWNTISPAAPSCQLLALREEKQRIESEIANLVESIAAGKGSASVMAAVGRTSKYMQTMRNQIVKRIERLGHGKAFSAKDFLDIASRTTIDVMLAQLAADGKIRRIRIRSFAGEQFPNVVKDRDISVEALLAKAFPTELRPG